MPHHGITWDLQGKLAGLPCAWDFPQIEREKFCLPQAQVGIWAGFVFINFDPLCEPLESYLECLPEHFKAFGLENRYKAVHGGKVLPCRDFSNLSTSEAVDLIQYFLFPNLGPWAGMATPLVYRFRPNGDNPQECIMEIMMLFAKAEDGTHPPVGKATIVGLQDSWHKVPGMGSAADVTDQVVNHAPTVQRWNQGRTPCWRAATLTQGATP